jgi:2-dehydro-3-deoxyphosphogluconate aldolase/(4S)-4-hydroxy-2-oxoglutarate aldolase
MSRFSRIEVALKMKETGMIPVFFHKDVEVCKGVIKACYAGGARVFEFTNRGDRAHEVFRDLIIWASKELPDMILGIGSVVDAGTTSLYIQLGANFIVSPILSEEMARVCNRRKIAWSPGCGSLSEISKAEELGAEVVKIFPGSSVGGPEFVKAVKGPCPWSSIMPTSGVTPEKANLEQWFKAGVHCVGMGSQLMVTDSSGNYDLAKIESLTRDALNIIRVCL